jgi:hypothetical protein
LDLIVEKYSGEILSVNKIQRNWAKGKMISFANSKVFNIIVVAAFLLCLYAFIIGLKTETSDPMVASHVEAYEERIKQINEICPSDFIVRSYLLPGYLLPTIVQWHNRTLLCWRTEFKNAKLKYGWFNIYDLRSNSRIKDTLSFMEIGKDNPTYTGLGHPKQEEPRVMVLSNNSILNLVAGNAKHRLGTIHYYLATYNPTKNRLEYGPILWMKYPGKQKNWVPFEDNSTVYFIQQINPLHIVTVTDIDAETNIATVSTVVRNTTAVTLPWNGEEYGKNIRGGTPAILVHGVRLSFFHTATTSIPDHSILTYYMGAITFCPTFPFQIHSISPVPIAPPLLYSGARWVHPGLDYVSYPTGIIADKDGHHVWVSLGHQDRDAYILKINVHQLYRTMRVVSECSP